MKDKRFRTKWEEGFVMFYPEGTEEERQKAWDETGGRFPEPRPTHD